MHFYVAILSPYLGRGYCSHLHYFLLKMIPFQWSYARTPWWSIEIVVTICVTAMFWIYGRCNVAAVPMHIVHDTFSMCSPCISSIWDSAWMHPFGSTQACRDLKSCYAYSAHHYIGHIMPIAEHGVMYYWSAHTSGSVPHAVHLYSQVVSNITVCYFPRHYCKLLWCMAA